MKARQIGFQMISWVLAIILTFPSPLGAQPAPSLSAADKAAGMLIPSSGNFKIPEHLGNIHIQSILPEADKPFVIVIQDAHAVLDAQNHIQALIDYLQSNYHVGIVAVEGDAGKIDPLIFRAFPDELIRKTVLSSYLKRGELSGAQMAAVFNPEEAEYFGIENWAVYEENYLAYLKADRQREPLILKINQARAKWDGERAQRYSPELNQYYQNVQSFKKEKTYLLDLFQYLKKFPGLQERLTRYPNIAKLVSSFSYEENEGRSRAELDTQVKQMAEAFKKKYLPFLPLNRQMDYHKNYQAFVTAQMETGAFLKNLIELAESAGAKPKLTPSMMKLLGHGETLSSIRGTLLFDELESLLGEIEESLITSPEQKAVANAYRVLDLLEDLARLELSRDQYFRYDKEKETADELIPGNTELLGPAVEFYQTALKRDQSFRENLNRLLKSKKIKSAIVVAGGFHSQGLVESLQADERSFAVITPKIQTLDGQETYHDVMTGKLSYRDYLRTTFYDAFVRHATLRMVSEWNEVDFRRNMKRWRDQIILDLAREGNAGNAGRYTRYLDLLGSVYQEKYGAERNVGQNTKEFLPLLEKELKGFRKQTLKHIWQDMSRKVEGLISGLRQLTRENELSPEKVQNLLEQSGDPVPRWLAPVGGLSQVPVDHITAWTRGDVTDSDVPAVISVPVYLPELVQQLSAKAAGIDTVSPDILVNPPAAVRQAVETIRSADVESPPALLPAPIQNQINQLTPEMAAATLAVAGNPDAQARSETRVTVRAGGTSIIPLDKSYNISLKNEKGETIPILYAGFSHDQMMISDPTTYEEGDEGKVMQLSFFKMLSERIVAYIGGDSGDKVLPALKSSKFSLSWLMVDGTPRLIIDNTNNQMELEVTSKQVPEAAPAVLPAAQPQNQLNLPNPQLSRFKSNFALGNMALQFMIEQEQAILRDENGKEYFRTNAPDLPAKITIGRDPEKNNAVLTGNGVSRTHAEISKNSDGTFSIRDLDSRNGTYVDNLRIKSAVLANVKMPSEAKPEIAPKKEPPAPEDQVKQQGFASWFLGLFQQEQIPDESLVTHKPTGTVNIVDPNTVKVDLNLSLLRDEPLVLMLPANSKPKYVEEYAGKHPREILTTKVDAQSDPSGRLRNLLARARQLKSSRLSQEQIMRQIYVMVSNALGGMRADDIKRLTRQYPDLKDLARMKNDDVEKILSAVDGFVKKNRNQQVPLGYFLTDEMEAGVCRHRALLFQMLGVEAGLNIKLVTGRYGVGGRHAWNEVAIGDTSYLVDTFARPIIEERESGQGQSVIYGADAMSIAMRSIVTPEMMKLVDVNVKEVPGDPDHLMLEIRRKETVSDEIVEGNVVVTLDISKQLKKPQGYHYDLKVGKYNLDNENMVLEPIPGEEPVSPVEAINPLAINPVIQKKELKPGDLLPVDAPIEYEGQQTTGNMTFLFPSEYEIAIYQNDNKRAVLLYDGKSRMVIENINGLKEGDVVTIGRENGANWQILDTRISRKHAVLSVEKGVVKITNLSGKSNAVIVKNSADGGLDSQAPYGFEGVGLGGVSPVGRSETRSIEARSEIRGAFKESFSLGSLSIQVLVQDDRLILRGENGDVYFNEPISNLPERIGIGRDPINKARIDSPKVSRNHAVLIKNPDGTFTLKDLNSTNGIFANGQRVTSWTLPDIKLPHLTEADAMNAWIQSLSPEERKMISLIRQMTVPDQNGLPDLSIAIVKVFGPKASPDIQISEQDVKAFLAASDQEKDRIAQKINQFRLIGDRASAIIIALQTKKDQIQSVIQNQAQQEKSQAEKEEKDAVVQALQDVKNRLQDRLDSEKKILTRMKEGKVENQLVVGDVHGSWELMENVLRQIEDAEKQGKPFDKVVFLGDMFDQDAKKDTGLPGSPNNNLKVFLMMQSIKAKLGDKAIFIIGNHDAILIRSILFGSFQTALLWYGQNRGKVLIHQVLQAAQAVLGEDPLSEDDLYNISVQYILPKAYRQSDFVPNENQKKWQAVGDRALQMLQEMAFWLVQNQQLYYLDDKKMLHVHAGIPTEDDGREAITVEDLEAAQKKWNELKSDLSPVNVLETLQMGGVAAVREKINQTLFDGFGNMIDNNSSLPRSAISNIFWVRNWAKIKPREDHGGVIAPEQRDILMRNVGANWTVTGHDRHLSMEIVRNQNKQNINNAFGIDHAQRSFMVFDNKQGVQWYTAGANTENKMTLEQMTEGIGQEITNLENEIKKIDEEIEKLLPGAAEQQKAIDAFVQQEADAADALDSQVLADKFKQQGIVNPEAMPSQEVLAAMMRVSLNKILKEKQEQQAVQPLQAGDRIQGEGNVWEIQRLVPQAGGAIIEKLNKKGEKTGSQSFKKIADIEKWPRVVAQMARSELRGVSNLRLPGAGTGSNEMTEDEKLTLWSNQLAGYGFTPEESEQAYEAKKQWDSIRLPNVDRPLNVAVIAAAYKEAPLDLEKTLRTAVMNGYIHKLIVVHDAGNVLETLQRYAPLGLTIIHKTENSGKADSMKVAMAYLDHHYEKESEVEEPDFIITTDADSYFVSENPDQSLAQGFSQVLQWMEENKYDSSALRIVPIVKSNQSFFNRMLQRMQFLKWVQSNDGAMMKLLRRFGFKHGTIPGAGGVYKMHDLYNAMEQVPGLNTDESEDTLVASAIRERGKVIAPSAATGIRVMTDVPATLGALFGQIRRYGIGMAQYVGNWPVLFFGLHAAFAYGAWYLIGFIREMLGVDLPLAERMLGLGMAAVLVAAFPFYMTVQISRNIGLYFREGEKEMGVREKSYKYYLSALFFPFYYILIEVLSITFYAALESAYRIAGTSLKGTKQPAVNMTVIKDGMQTQYRINRNPEKQNEVESFRLKKAAEMPVSQRGVIAQQSRDNLLTLSPGEVLQKSVDQFVGEALQSEEILDPVALASRFQAQNIVSPEKMPDAKVLAQRMARSLRKITGLKSDENLVTVQPPKAETAAASRSEVRSVDYLIQTSQQGDWNGLSSALERLNHYQLRKINRQMSAVDRQILSQAGQASTLTDILGVLNTQMQTLVNLKIIDPTTLEAFVSRIQMMVTGFDAWAVSGDEGRTAVLSGLDINKMQEYESNLQTVITDLQKSADKKAVLALNYPEVADQSVVFESLQGFKGMIERLEFIVEDMSAFDRQKISDFQINVRNLSQPSQWDSLLRSVQASTGRLDEKLAVALTLNPSISDALMRNLNIAFAPLASLQDGASDAVQLKKLAYRTLLYLTFRLSNVDPKEAALIKTDPDKLKNFIEQDEFLSSVSQSFQLQGGMLSFDINRFMTAFAAAQAVARAA